MPKGKMKPVKAFAVLRISDNDFVDTFESRDSAEWFIGKDTDVFRIVNVEIREVK